MTTDTAVLEKVETIELIGDEWNVVLHNDDKTTVEFVVHLLIQHFGIETQDAIDLTYKIHDNGQAVVKSYSNYDIAEQKATDGIKIARSYGYPLKITVEQ